MKIRIQETDGVVEIIVDGNVMQENISQFKNRLHDLIDNGKLKMVLNLVATEYISSLCLAVIVDVKNRLSGLDGDIKLAMPNRVIRNLLEITNLVRKIELYDTLEEAIQAFGDQDTP